MDQPPLPHSETIVSAVHGNAAVSDTVRPVLVQHSGHGVIVCPPPSANCLPRSSPAVVGMVHFALPTLPRPRQDPPQGPLSGRAILSTSLEVGVAPHSGRHQAEEVGDHGDPSPMPLHGPTKVIGVHLYIGRERSMSWERDSEQSRQTLPADRDFRIHVRSDIYGESENLLNNQIGGVGVTLTIEFVDEAPILLSSVALVQVLRVTGHGGF